MLTKRLPISALILSLTLAAVSVAVNSLTAPFAQQKSDLLGLLAGAAEAAEAGQEDEEDAPPRADSIAVFVFDDPDGSGVDENSLKMYLNSQPIDFETKPTDNGYILLYEPTTTEFDLNRQIVITVKGQDNAGNRFEEEHSFSVRAPDPPDLALDEVETAVHDDIPTAQGSIADLDIGTGIDNIFEVDMDEDGTVDEVKQLTQPAGVKGDVNSDGEIRSNDTSLALGIAFAGVDSLNGEALARIRSGILADDISRLKLRTVELYRTDTLPIDSRKIDGKSISWRMPPEHSMLLQNFPNPFNPDTWIPYQLREGSEVTIRIFSSAGELIQELDLGYKPAGLYVSRDRAAYWDGRSKFGTPVASGVYLYSIRAGGFSAVRKLIVLR